MKETLHTCPTRGTTGFTARGLKAHKRDGTNRNAIVPAAPDTTDISAMSVDQLAETGKALDRASDLHENTAATCRVLHGLVFLEAKSKLAHGQFQPWIKKHFPASYRDAARRMAAARDLVAAIADKKRLKKLKLESPLPLALPGKSDRPVTFDSVAAQAALLANLAGNIEALKTSQLDLSNPVVAAASKYVGERSWTQLVLDLGDTDGRETNGGKRARPNGTKRRTADEKEYDDATQRAMDWYEFGLLNLKEIVVNPDETWLHLPDVELANVADILKLAAKKADDACRARKIQPSKLRTWEDAQ